MDGTGICKAEVLQEEKTSEPQGRWRRLWDRRTEEPGQGGLGAPAVREAQEEPGRRLPPWSPEPHREQPPASLGPGPASPAWRTPRPHPWELRRIKRDIDQKHRGHACLGETLRGGGFPPCGPPSSRPAGSLPSPRGGLSSTLPRPRTDRLRDTVPFPS